MKPRCLITGSRYGLGIALVNKFKDDYDIIEYDLELGQDIELPEVRDQIIEDLKTCQLFFNNSQTHQLELLERAFALQNDLAIIVSNSTVGFYSALPSDVMEDPLFLMYVESKKELSERCRQLQDQQAHNEMTRSWIINIRMNWLDTEQHKERTEDKMDPFDVADMIYQTLSMWPRIAVQEIVLVSPYRSMLNAA